MFKKVMLSVICMASFFTTVKAEKFGVDVNVAHTGKRGHHLYETCIVDEYNQDPIEFELDDLYIQMFVQFYHDHVFFLIKIFQTIDEGEVLISQQSIVAEWNSTGVITIGQDDNDDVSSFMVTVEPFRLESIKE